MASGLGPTQGGGWARRWERKAGLDRRGPCETFLVSYVSESSPSSGVQIRKVRAYHLPGESCEGTNPSLPPQPGQRMKRVRGMGGQWPEGWRQ